MSGHQPGDFRADKRKNFKLKPLDQTTHRKTRLKGSRFENQDFVPKGFSFGHKDCVLTRMFESSAF